MKYLIFIFFLNSLLVIDFKNRIFSQMIDLNKDFSEEKYKEYDEFIKKYAPSGDALVAVQRMAGPYLLKKQWIQAIKIYDKYRNLFPSRDYYFQKIISLLLEKDQGLIVENLGEGINTESDEYNPIPSIDGSKLYFNSRNRFDSHGGEDIYLSELRNNTWQRSVNLGQGVNTKRNDFITGISADGNKMILMGSYNESFGRGDLFFADKTSEGWSEIKHFPEPINSEAYESDGFLTSDGKALLFVSDRKGGIGETVEKNTIFHGDYWGNTDIYVCLHSNSEWSKPINLGDVINTSYAERTPFLHPDGKTLYFSSDANYGLGRLDLFKTTRLKEDSWTEWSEPENLGKEINTTGNDYGYKIATKGDIAFFTRDSKTDASGGTDIYSITLPEKAKPKTVITIQGKVSDRFGNPIEAEIVWEDLSTGQNIGKLKTDPVDGAYVIVLSPGKHYGYYAMKEGYYPSSNNINLIDKNKSINIIENIFLPRLDTTIVLNNLFFDYSKIILKSESSPELDRLVKVLKNYSDKKIEIAGYTDSIGSVNFNIGLSKKRAEAVANYLIKRGCKRDMILIKAYGKSRPISTNSSEEGRSKNRRVEFKFLNMEDQNIQKRKLNLIRKSSVDIKVKYRIYTDGKSFSILVSNWENEDDAIKDALSFRLKGYDAYTIKTYAEELNQEWYEVRIGNINSEKEAEELLRKF